MLPEDCSAVLGKPFSQESAMSKGMDQKKSTKKAPTKTLKEKRAAKAAKKNG